jgi:hypothetical protein
LGDVTEVAIGSIVLIKPSMEWAKEELQNNPDLEMKDLIQRPWIGEVKNFMLKVLKKTSVSKIM